jgi:cation:H+ antiporter
MPFFAADPTERRGNWTPSSYHAPMIFDSVLLVVGLAMLLVGGEILVRGASALARQVGVSPLVVGLTVVAFGTSAPELAVNALAAWQGNTDLSFGNIVGSNIANLGLILGIAALVRPLKVRGTVISREIPIMLAATLIFALMGAGIARDAAYSRFDSVILLVLFAGFIYYTIARVLRGRAEDPFTLQAAERLTPARLRSGILNTLFVIAGLVVLAVGARMTVNGAVSIAEALQVPKVIIGLTIVAIGTSLPELATSLAAIRHDQVDLAVGNVVGSNILNLLFIMGVTAAIRPVPVPTHGIWDLAVMVGLSVLLLPLSMTGGRRILRREGALMLVVYIAYMVWRAFLGKAS